MGPSDSSGIEHTWFTQSSPKERIIKFWGTFFFQKKWSAWFRVIGAWNAKFTREILSLPVKFRYPSVTGELLFFGQTNLPHGDRLVFWCTLPLLLCTRLLFTATITCILQAWQEKRWKKQSCTFVSVSHWWLQHWTGKFYLFVTVFMIYIFPMCSHLVIFSPLRKGLDHGSWVASASWTGSTT